MNRIYTIITKCNWWLTTVTTTGEFSDDAKRERQQRDNGKTPAGRLQCKAQLGISLSRIWGWISQ